MGIITEITRQKGNKKRVSIFVDGMFFCGLDELTAVKNRLKVGDEIDAEELENLQAESEYVTALDKSLGYLSVRPRSRREIKTYLSGKGYLAATVDKVSARLTELGYLDDESYAKQYISENMSRYGSIRLKNELIKRGVARETADNALQEADRDGALADLARSLWRSCGGDRYKLKQKLYAKGCSGDDIETALSLAEEENLFD